VTVEVGTGRFIPTLEEKLIGLKPEDEETWMFIPADYAYKSGPEDRQFSREG